MNVRLINSVETSKLKGVSKYFRVLSIRENNLYCGEVFHQNGVSRAFDKSKQTAIQKALSYALKELKGI